MMTQPLSNRVTPPRCTGAPQSWRAGLRPTVLLATSLLLAAAVALPRAYGADAHGTPAADHGAPPAKAGVSATKPVTKTLPDGQIVPEGTDLGQDLKQALKDKLISKKKLTLVVSEKPDTVPAKATAHAVPTAKPAAHAAPAPATGPGAHGGATAAAAHAPAVASHSAPVVNPRASRDYIKARAAALTGHETETVLSDSTHGDPHGGAHWSYEGDTGPQNWGKLKPEFNVCALGKRQSPINIVDSAALQGPAEPLLFNYQPSSGSVVNNGHTVQVDVQGENTLTVRGSVYRLMQFHFHSPSEEQVNYRNFAMVAHLVHQNAEGQLAVVAVLLDPGEVNPVIQTVWTYMPLDVNDRVRLPLDAIDLSKLLPQDQRYYQFIGSLTTPPCTEGVLWMVLKKPAPIAREQLRLFQQLYPANARPVQPANNRPVRSAM